LFSFIFIIPTNLKLISNVFSHDSIWAWQFLRVNPEYRSAWQDRPKSISHTFQEQFSFPYRQYKQTKDDSKAASWGLHSWIDPDSDGDEGRPLFWLEMPTLHISLASIPEKHVSTSLGDLLSQVKKQGDVAGLVLLDGDLILRIKIFGFIMQIRIFQGGSNIDPEMGINIAFDLNPELRVLFDNLRTFSRYLYPLQNRQTRVHPEKLLLAINGQHHGHTHKQIAVDMFGSDRVDADWSDSKSLRDLVYYRIKLAQKIVDGDYKDFVSGRKSFFSRS
jgi:hypothetical protein